MSKGYVQPFKYGNNPVIIDGIRFDSRKEGNRYKDLCLLQRAGTISDLERQVSFELLPSQKDENGKVIERPIRYVADFTYIDRNGDLVVEDCKGYKTPEYTLKRKLMLYFKGIRIRET